MNGLEVVVRVVVGEHGDVGERPVGVHGVLEVGVVAGYTELEVSVGNAERIHHADVYRAVTGCIRDRRSDGVVEDVLLRGECQLEVHRAVALAFQLRHLYTAAILGVLNRTARLWCGVVGDTTVRTYGADGCFARRFELNVLARAQHRIVRAVVVVAIRQRHEVIGLVVDQTVVALGKRVVRDAQAVEDALIRAICLQTWNWQF